MSPALGTASRITLGALGLIVAAAVILFAIGSSRVSTRYSTAFDHVTVVADSASVALGDYLTKTNGCTNCHGADLSGMVRVDAPPFRIVATNLTSGAGGVGSLYTDDDFVRAIRHGVRPDGRGLYMMPSSAYWAYSDLEISAIVAYLRTVPAVDNALGTTEIKALGRLIAAVDKGFTSEAALIDPTRVRPAMPAFGPTAEWGEYRTQVLCSHCHGMDLRGGKHPDPAAPPGLSLESVKGWSVDQFVHAMRTGMTPDGRTLNVNYMPWKSIGQMTDEELTAIWLRLQQL